MELNNIILKISNSYNLHRIRQKGTKKKYSNTQKINQMHSPFCNQFSPFFLSWIFVSCRSAMLYFLYITIVKIFPVFLVIHFVKDFLTNWALGIVQWNLFVVSARITMTRNPLNLVLVITFSVSFLGFGFPSLRKP